MNFISITNGIPDGWRIVSSEFEPSLYECLFCRDLPGELIGGWYEAALIDHLREQ